MDAWATAVIAGATAIGSSALTGYLSWRIGEVERRDRRAAELAAAVAAFAYALDRLDFELRNSPPPLGRVASWTNRTTERQFPHLDWILGFISMRLFGRGTLHAIDAFMIAMNRLLLVGSRDLIDTAEQASALLSRAAPRDEAWRAEWFAMRGRLIQASRAAVGAPELQEPGEAPAPS